MNNIKLGRRQHAKDRFLERHNLTLNRHERKEITDQINEISVAVVKQKNNSRLHLIAWNGKLIPVVYNSKQKTIVTALPESAIGCFSDLHLTFSSDDIQIKVSTFVGVFSTDPVKFSVPSVCQVHGKLRQLLIVDPHTGIEYALQTQNMKISVYQSNREVSFTTLDCIEKAFELTDYHITPFTSPPI